MLSGKVKVLSASYELQWLEPVCLNSIVLIEYLNSTEVLHVVNGVDLRAATALEVVVRGGITSQEETLQLIVSEASKYLIKNVEAALSSTTLHDTRLLQQICIKFLTKIFEFFKLVLLTVGNITTNRCTIRLEQNLHIFAKAAGIVVSERFGIAES